MRSTTYFALSLAFALALSSLRRCSRARFISSCRSVSESSSLCITCMSWGTTSQICKKYIHHLSLAKLLKSYELWLNFCSLLSIIKVSMAPERHIPSKQDRGNIWKRSCIYQPRDITFKLLSIMPQCLIVIFPNIHLNITINTSAWTNKYIDTLSLQKHLFVGLIVPLEAPLVLPLFFVSLLPLAFSWLQLEIGTRSLLLRL